MVTTSSAEISRRQFFTAGGLTFVAACIAPSCLFAEEDHLVKDAFKEAATAKVTVQTLRRNISVLLGAGGNIAVLTGPDGKLIIDSEIVTAAPNTAAALASINADPVKQLINTHWHFDHTGGNDWVHKAGASILAQENTRKHLLKDTRVEGWQHTFPAAPAGAIPTTVLPKITPCTPTIRLWFLSTICRHIRIRTFPCTLRRLTFFTPGTLFGTEITRS